MALKIFNKPTHRQNAVQSVISLIHFNGNFGVVNFNRYACTSLGMKAGDRILFAQDDETKHWYFSFGSDLTNGYKLTQMYKRYFALRCSCKEVCDKMVRQTREDSVTYVIAKKAKVIDGQRWYRILTQTPYRA